MVDLLVKDKWDFFLIFLDKTKYKDKGKVRVFNPIKIYQIKKIRAILKDYRSGYQSLKIKKHLDVSFFDKYIYANNFNINFLLMINC